MTQVTFLGNPVEISGRLPQKGQRAPAFTLAANDLSDVTLADFAGKRKILNIFPCIDTSTCAASVRAFNSVASRLRNTVVLCISADLPFAQKRLCGALGLDNVMPLSTFRNPECLFDYGVAIIDGPLKRLSARAVIVLDERDVVLHSELVNEMADEPNYDAVLTALD